MRETRVSETKVSESRVSEKPDVVIYTSAWCGYCSAAKTLLTKKGVTFTEVRVDKEAGMRAEMEQRSGLTSVPQVFIGDHHVGGFDELMDLDMDDELNPMLGLAEPDD